MQTAADYFRQGEYKKTTEILAWDRQPKAQLLKGYAFFENNQISEAQDCLRSAANDQNFILADYAHFALAETYFVQKNYPEAAKVYSLLISNFPSSPLTAEAQAQYIKCLNNGIVAAPPEPKPASAKEFFQLGEKAFAERDYPKAQKYFKEIVKKYPGSSFTDDAFVMLGRCYYRTGDQKTAIKWFNLAINSGKNSAAAAYYYKGFAWGKRGKLNNTISSFRAVINYYPKSIYADDTAYYIGYYYEAHDLIPQAYKAYLSLLSKYPASPMAGEAAFRMGMSYFKKGALASARKSFLMGTKTSDQKLAAANLFWASKSAQKIGQKEKAAEGFRQIVASYDHTYYTYRSQEILKEEFGESLPLSELAIDKEFAERIETIMQASPGKLPEEKITPVLEALDNISIPSSGESLNAEKFNQLMEIGLPFLAAKEASDNPLYLSKALMLSGNFRAPIKFAENKISKNDPALLPLAYPKGYWKFAEEYGKQYNVNPYFVLAIIREESRFNPEAYSHAKAYGLMQIIPQTGKLIAKAIDYDDYYFQKLAEPQVNINMGTYYISKQLEAFPLHPGLALAAYNGGPGRVKKWLKSWKAKHGDEYFDIDEFVETEIAFSETRYYVKKVLNSFYEYQRIYSSTL